MIPQNYTAAFLCGPNEIIAPTVLAVLVLTFHIPLLKVLVVNLRLELPRHKLIAGLSMSDCLSTTMTSIITIATSQINLISGLEACFILRRIGQFNFITTTVINSLTISALCFERYVACVHSFRLDEIFTSRRVSYGLFFAWFCGGALGTFGAIFSTISRTKVLADNNIMVQVIVPLFVIPSSLIIIVVQITLYMFSRKKLIQVLPVTNLSNATEAAVRRRSQIKIAVVAGLTALLYLVCFMPVCTFMLLQMNGLGINSSMSQKIIFGLRMMNSVIDPFLYGLCIVDTREALFKDIRRIKAAITTVSMPSFSNA